MTFSYGVLYIFSHGVILKRALRFHALLILLTSCALMLLHLLHAQFKKKFQVGFEALHVESTVGLRFTEASYNNILIDQYTRSILIDTSYLTFVSSQNEHLRDCYIVLPQTLLHKTDILFQDSIPFHKCTPKIT